jgi:hypothetical protein
MADFEGALPIKTARNGEVVAAMCDSTGVNTLAIDANGAIIASISDGTHSVAVNDDGSINAVVTATALDIRALDHSTDSVKLGDGTTFIDVNTDGSINVRAVTISTNNVFKYNTSAAVAKNLDATHDYIVTDLNTFHGETVCVGARGAVKVQLGTWDGTTFVVKSIWFQLPACNEDHRISHLALAGNGTKAIRLVITNIDNNASDIYSNIQGAEVLT